MSCRNLNKHHKPGFISDGAWAMQRVLIAALTCETSALMLIPATPSLLEPIFEAPLQEHMVQMPTYQIRMKTVHSPSNIFPTGAFLIADESLSPAKAKIEAAKANAAAKLAERGLPSLEKEAKVVEFKVAIDTSAKSKDPFAEANALREKRMNIEDQLGLRKPSKSQSAQISQVFTPTRPTSRRACAHC